MGIDDTHPRAREVQIELLRSFSPARRFAMASALTRATIEWSRRAVRESMPDAAEADVLLRWIELTYGRELAERLRPFKARLGVVQDG